MKIRKLISLALALALLTLIPPAAAAAGNDYKAWNQADDRWKALSIAGNASAGATTTDKKVRMENVGCYVTATCKLLIHSGQQGEDFTPDKCLEALKKHGLLSNGGSLSFRDAAKTKAFFAEYGPELEYSYTASNAMNRADAVKTVRGYIDEGYYVIVHMPGGAGHFVAVDEVRDNDVYVMDNKSVHGVYSGGRSIDDITKFKYSGGKSYPAGPKDSDVTPGWSINDIVTGIRQKLQGYTKSRVYIQTETRPAMNMEQGKPFYFKGKITSGYNITSATVSILTADGKPLAPAQSTTVTPNKATVDIATSGLDSLKFGRLEPGSYLFRLTAKNAVGKTASWEQAFSIQGKLAASAAPTPTQPSTAPVPVTPAPQPIQPQSPQSSLAISPSTKPGNDMEQGKPFYFKGKITSNYNVTSATVSILSPDGGATYQTRTITPNKTTVDIATSGLDSLKFGKLEPGSYLFRLTAKDASGKSQTWEQAFSIKGTASTLTISPTTKPGNDMARGKPFYFKGKITSNYNVTSATVSILSPDGGATYQTRTITPNKTTVDIATSGLDSLKFGKLEPGSYLFRLTAKDASGKTQTWEQTFSIR